MTTLQDYSGYVSSSYLRTLRELVKDFKLRSYEVLRIAPGARVLDVGCGPGTDTIPLAKRTGPSGRVVGVDFDPQMIAEGEAAAREAGVSGWVDHVLGDANGLEFVTDTFDAAHCERLFIHLRQPELVLSEMIRVTRPEGWIVATDTDFGTVSIDSDDLDMERRVVRALSEFAVANGYSGRKLFGQFRRNRLVDISVEICPAYVTDFELFREVAQLNRVRDAYAGGGVIGAQEFDNWCVDLERLSNEGRFFASWNMIRVAGRKK